MTEPLSPLREVLGVIGSFACNASGEVLQADMPPEYSSAALESTATRLLGMFQTADEGLANCRSVRLAFGEHELMARRFRFGVLCVLTTRAPDRPTLTMTSRLVARHFSALGS
jgi:hypothetical protein